MFCFGIMEVAIKTKGIVMKKFSKNL